jgi:hypothetical protein
LIPKQKGFNEAIVAPNKEHWLEQHKYGNANSKQPIKTTPSRSVAISQPHDCQNGPDRNKIAQCVDRDR